MKIIDSLYIKLERCCRTSYIYRYKINTFSVKKYKAFKKILKFSSRNNNSREKSYYYN